MCLDRLDRFALDLVLAHQPERQRRADEADDPTEHQHLVESGQEAFASGIDDYVMGMGGKSRDGRAEIAR
jgi:hypothetical protein